MYRVFYPSSELFRASDRDSPVPPTSGTEIDKKLMVIAKCIEEIDIYLFASTNYVAETQENLETLRRYATMADADLHSAKECIWNSEKRLQDIRLELRALFQNTFGQDSFSESPTEKIWKNSNSTQWTNASRGTIPVHIQRSIRKYANANSIDLDSYTVAYSTLDGTKFVVMHPKTVESDSKTTQGSGSTGSKYHQQNVFENDVEVRFSLDGSEREGLNFKDGADIAEGQVKNTHLQCGAADQGKYSGPVKRKEVLDICDKIRKARVRHQDEKARAAVSAISSCEYSFDENVNCASPCSSENLNEAFRNGNVQETNTANLPREPEMCNNGFLISDSHVQEIWNDNCFTHAGMHLKKLINENIWLNRNPALEERCLRTRPNNQPNELRRKETNSSTYPVDEVNVSGINKELLNKQIGYTNVHTRMLQSNGGLSKTFSHHSGDLALKSETETELKTSSYKAGTNRKQRGEISVDKNSNETLEQADVYNFPFTQNEWTSIPNTSNHLSANLEAQTKLPVKAPFDNSTCVNQTPESLGYSIQSDNDNKRTSSHGSGSEKLYKSSKDCPEGESVSNVAIRAGSSIESLTDFVPTFRLTTGSKEPLSFRPQRNVKPISLRGRNAVPRIDHPTNEISADEDVDNEESTSDSIYTLDLTLRAMTEKIKKRIETISENRKYLLGFHNLSKSTMSKDFRTEQSLPSTSSNPSCSYANDSFISNERIRTNKGESHSPKRPRDLFGDQDPNAENMNISGIENISSLREKTSSSTISNAPSVNDSSSNMPIKMSSYIICKDGLELKDCDYNDRQVFPEKHLCSNPVSCSRTSGDLSSNKLSKYLETSSMLDELDNRTEHENVSGRSSIGVWDPTDSRMSECEKFHAFSVNIRRNRSIYEKLSLSLPAKYSYSDTNFEIGPGEITEGKDLSSFNSSSSTSGFENKFQNADSVMDYACADNSMSND